MPLHTCGDTQTHLKEHGNLRRPFARDTEDEDGCLIIAIYEGGHVIDELLAHFVCDAPVPARRAIPHDVHGIFAVPVLKLVRAADVHKLHRTRCHMLRDENTEREKVRQQASEMHEGLGTALNAQRRLPRTLSHC